MKPIKGSKDCGAVLGFRVEGKTENTGKGKRGQGSFWGASCIFPYERWRHGAPQLGTFSPLAALNSKPSPLGFGV